MSRSGKWFAVVAACASILTGSAFAAKTATETEPKPGWWKGQTEEQRRVDFDVAKSGSKLKVVHFYTDSKFKCSNGTTRYGSFYDLSAKIKKGEFSIDRSNPPGIPDWGSTFAAGLNRRNVPRAPSRAISPI